MMDQYRIRLVPLGRWGGLPQADSLFGQLCWTLRLLRGQEELERFLAAYEDSVRQGSDPPLVLSDGFPEGFLPKPLLPLSWSAPSPAHQQVQLTRAKDFKRVRFVKQDWLLAARAELSGVSLAQALSADPALGAEANRFWMENLTSHNTIDRNSGTVRREGGYFQQVDYQFPGLAGGFAFQVFLRTGYFGREDLQELLEVMSKEGLGRDTSVGLGRFSYSLEGYSFPPLTQANAFMALTSFVPGVHDPVEGFWEVTTKYGKVGGGIAAGFPRDSTGSNPFKKPLLMLSAGSVFKTDSSRSWYGQLVPDVHTNPRVRHYGLCFPLEVRL